MDQKEFDKLVRQNLTDHPSEVDLDKFWTELEPKLPQEKKRSRFFFFLLFFGILGFIATEIITNKVKNYTLSKEIDMKNSSIQNKEKNSNTEIKSQIAEVSTNDTRKIDKNSELKKANINIENNKSTYHQNKIISKTNNASKNKILKNIVSSRLLDNALNPTIKATAKKPSVVASRINLQNAELKNEKTIVATIENNKGEKISSKPESNIKNIDTTIAYPLVNNEFTPSNNLDKNELTRNIVGEDQKNSALSSNALLLNTNVNSNPDSIHHLENISNLNLPTEIKKKPNNLFKFEISPIVGVGMYSKKLYSNNGTLEHLNYLRIRKLTESKLEECLIGLHFNMSYDQIGIFTGIEYSQKNEKFEFSTSTEKFEFSNSIIRKEFVNGVVEQDTGISWHSIGSSRTIKHYNKIQQWNIPLGLSYKLPLKNNDILISGGGIFSITNRIKGISIDHNLDFQNWGSSIDLKYRSSLGVGYFMEVKYNYKLNSRIGFTNGIRIQGFKSSYQTGSDKLNYQSYLLISSIVYRF